MTIIRLIDARLVLLFSLLLATFLSVSGMAERVESSTKDIAAAKEIIEGSKVALEVLDNDKLKSFVAEVQNNKAKINVSEVAQLAGSKKVCKKGCTSFLENTETSYSDTPGVPKLILFVSWSMGKEALASLGKQVQQLGGRLVFRGLINNSFVETQKAILSLRRDLGVGVAIDIDPPLFEDMQVTQVPTFVVQEKTTHDRVSGSMSLKAAIEIMAYEGETQSAKDLRQQSLWGGQ